MPTVTLPEPARSEAKRLQFLSRLIQLPSGCLVYPTGVRSDGYRQVGLGSKTDGTRRYELAHRYAYTLWHGSVPEGLTVDHECHNLDRSCPGGRGCLHRACVAPEHLIARTTADNTAHSDRSTPQVNKAKTHCPANHEYTPDNILPATWNGYPSRKCRACHNARMRAYRARIKQT